MVADILRERIVSGTLAKGDKLPRQEDLLAEFNVSKPSMREALRILETEGLVSVQRGKLGGAVVHAPQSHDAAYMLALVLQAKQVPIDDVGAALQNLEPVCAGLCAERTDRRAVVRELRRVHEASVAAMGDDVAFARELRRFHAAVVASCGNDTVKTVVGSLEDLWSAKETVAIEADGTRSAAVRRAQRDSSLKSHAQIIALIEKGDAAGVNRAWNRHDCVIQQRHRSGGSTEMIMATLLRQGRAR